MLTLPKLNDGDVIVRVQDGNRNKLFLIPAPGLVYSVWELRGLLEVPRKVSVKRWIRADDWCSMEYAALYPFQMEQGMQFEVVSSAYKD